MKSLVLFLFTISLSLTNPTASIFDNSDYVPEKWVSEMLETQFVQDFDSALLLYSMEEYAKLHFDEIEHISGHYAKESDIYYYALFGKKSSDKKVELIEVDKEHFSAGSFKKFSSSLALRGLCRRGNGFPNWPVCPGTDCQIWTNGCLGIICNYQECR